MRNFWENIMAISTNALFNDLVKDLQDGLDARGSKFDLMSILTTGQKPIPEEMSVDEFAALQIGETFLKKFQDGHTSAADKAALDKFISSNVRCGEWTLRHDRTLEEDLLLGLFKAEIYKFFYRGGNKATNHILGNLSQILSGCDVGPGASGGARGTDFYTKLFDSPLHTTRRSLYSIYESHFSNVPFWRTAENQRISQHGDVEVVQGNRLSFVPKNVDTSRCICTEPALNMFFQQGVKQILEGRLRQRFRIDLADQQECNKDLARVGSLSDRFSTIDLESASDTVSLRMIQETDRKSVV